MPTTLTIYTDFVRAPPWTRTRVGLVQARLDCYTHGMPTSLTIYTDFV